MAIPCPKLSNGSPLVVGSAAGASDLAAVSPDGLIHSCDLVEVRLDMLGVTAAKPWQHLSTLPLLFTARRADEGGAGNLDVAQRSDLLQSILEEASLIDIEVASISELAPLLDQIRERQLPWIASFHDFDKLPDEAVLTEACERAREAGAAAFKLAAHLKDQSDLKSLVAFQVKDHGITTATMGMGELGAQSRLQCAKAGSVLNYGYLGDTPTAPGQMSAGELKAALRK